MPNMDNPSRSSENNEAHEAEEIKQARDQVNSNLIDIYLQKRELFPERAAGSASITNTTLFEVNRKETDGRNHYEEDASRAIGKQNWIAQELWNARIAPKDDDLTKQVEDALAPEDRQNVMQNFHFKMYNAVFRKEAQMEYSSDLEWYSKWEEHFRSNPNMVRQIKFQEAKNQATSDLISTLGNDRQDSSYRDPIWVAGRLLECRLRPEQFDSNSLVREIKAIYGSEFNKVEKAVFENYANLSPDELDRYIDMPNMIEDPNAFPDSLDGELVRAWQNDPRVKEVLPDSLDSETGEPLPASDRDPLVIARRSGFWPAIKNKFSSIKEIKNFVVEKGTDALIGSVFGAGIRWGVTAAVGPGMMASAMVGATVGGFKAFGREINKDYENYLEQRAQAGDKASQKELEKIKKQSRLEKGASRLKVRELIRKYHAVPPDQKSEALRKTQMGAILGLVGGVVGYDLAHNHPELVAQALDQVKKTGSSLYEMSGISTIIGKIANFEFKPFQTKPGEGILDRISGNNLPKSVPQGPLAPAPHPNPAEIPHLTAETAPSPVEALPVTIKPIKIDIPNTNIGIPSENGFTFSDNPEHIQEYLKQNQINLTTSQINTPDEYYARQAAEMTAKGLKPDFDGSFSSLKGDVEGQIGNYLLHKPEILKDPAVMEWIKTNRPDVKLESFTSQTFDKNNVDHLMMLKAYQQIHPDYYNKMFTTMYGSTKILNSDNPTAFNSAHPDLFKHGIPMRRPDSTKLFDKILTDPNNSLPDLGHLQEAPLPNPALVVDIPDTDNPYEIGIGNADKSAAYNIDVDEINNYIGKNNLKIETFELKNADQLYARTANEVIKNNSMPDFDQNFSSLKGELEGWMGNYLMKQPEEIKNILEDPDVKKYLVSVGYPISLDRVVGQQFNPGNAYHVHLLRAYKIAHPDKYDQMFKNMYAAVKVLNTSNDFNPNHPDLFKHNIVLKRPNPDQFFDNITKAS